MFNTLRVVGFLLKTAIFDHADCQKALAACEQGDYQAGYHKIQKIAKDLMKCTGARIVYHGLENLPEENGVLFVGNHQSYFDIPILLSVMESPTAFVAKESLGKIPALRLWLKMIGSVYINRSDMRQSMQAILAAGEKLKQGLNIAIFPEGTRSRSDEHGEFKKGSLKPATMAGCPVVPYFIDGSHRIFESNKGVRIAPAEVHVYIGKPIPVANLSRGEQKALADSIQDIVLNLKNVIA